MQKHVAEDNSNSVTQSQNVSWGIYMSMKEDNSSCFNVDIISSLKIQLKKGQPLN